MANFIRKLKRLFQKKRLVGQFEHVFIADMPDGHLVCGCGNPWFHCVLAEGERRVYAVCAQCEQQLTLHFSPETNLDGLGDGEMHCMNHPKSHWVVIKNQEWLSVGCRNCKEEVLIRLWKRHLETEEEVAKQGLIIQ